MVYIVLIIIVVLIIDALIALKFESIANMKGHQGYFWWCFLLGVIGCGMVIALPDRQTTFSNDSESVTQPVKQMASDSDDTLPEL